MAADYKSETIGQKLDETGKTAAADVREKWEDVRGLDRGTTGSTAGYTETNSPPTEYVSDPAAPDSGGSEVHGKGRRVLSASTLTGDGVRNSAGEDLGKIEEIMIDLDSGRIAYAVLSFGGFLGIGDKLFAVPWESLTVDTAEHQFVLNVDKKTLENAPGFDKDNWPDMADSSWGSQLHGHYGQKPYWEGDVTSSGDYTGNDRIDQTDRDRTYDTTTTTTSGSSYKEKI